MKRLFILFCLLTANNLLGMQAATLLPAMQSIYNAAYFILPNYRFLYDACNMALITYQQSKVDFPSIENMQEVDLPAATKNVIAEVCDEMGLDKKIRVQTKPMTSPAAIDYNLLVVDPDLIKLHDDEQQKFIFRHEFAHIKNNDFIRIAVTSAALPFVSYAALNLAQNITYSGIAKYAGNNKAALTIVPALVNNVFTYYFLNLAMWSMGRKNDEYKADSDAVNSPQMGLAGVRMLARWSKSDYKDVRKKNLQLENQNNVWGKVRNGYGYGDKWLRLQSHPTDWNRYLAINAKLKAEFGCEINGVEKV